MKIGKFQVNTNLFFKKKQLLNWSTLIYSTMKKKLFKKIIFFSWLNNNYLPFDTIMLIFYINKLIKNSQLLSFLNATLNNINVLSLVKINFYYLQVKWNVLESFLISKILRFNLKYLVNSFTLKKFLIEYFIFYATVKNKIFSLLFFFTFFGNKTKLNKTNTFIELLHYIYLKIDNIKSNPLQFLDNIFLFNKYIKSVKLFYANFFFDTKHFNRFYFGYQAFLNGSLYLNWYALFPNSISSSTLNVLLLWNFNQLLFWSGSLPKNFFIQELFIWGKENVFFRKGDPYYSYKLQHLSNLTYTNLTYTNLNLSEFFTRYDLKYLNTNDFLRLSKVTKNFYSNVFFNKFFF